MRTQFLGRPAPLYFLGDSQCLVFSHLLFAAEYQGRTQMLITQARYCPGLKASNFSLAQDRLHEGILRALLSDSLIDRENKALYQYQSPHASILSLLAGRVRAAPVLVFFCGSGDLVGNFLRQLGHRYDFYFPCEETELAAFPPHSAQQVFPLETARRYLQDLCQPLFRGLRQLKAMGFEHLFLHELVPQTPDDALFSQVYGYNCPARIRTKALLLFNQILAEGAQAAGIGWISIWEQVTINHRLRPEYALDGIHLNKTAAFLSVETLWQILCQALPAPYLPPLPEAPDLVEAINELSIQLAERSLQGQYTAAIELATSRKNLLEMAAAHPELAPQLESLVSGLHALAQAYYALGQLAALPALLKPFAHVFALHRPLAAPHNRHACFARYGLHDQWQPPSYFDPALTDTLIYAVLHGLPLQGSPEQR